MGDSAVEAAVGAATGLRNMMAMQEKDNALLRQVLDNQAATITNLVDSVPGPQKLAEVGNIGTRLHVTA